MNKFLMLLLLLGSLHSYGQIVVETDTITVGNTSGAGGVSLFGKAYLKNIILGTSHDSVLVRNANGSIRMVPRSSFGSGSSGVYLPLTGGTLTGALRSNIGVTYSAISTGYAASFGYSTGDWGVRLGADGMNGIIQAAQNTTAYNLKLQPYGGTVNVVGAMTIGGQLDGAAANFTGTISGSSTGSFTGSMNASNYKMAAWDAMNWSSSIMQVGGVTASQWQTLDFYTGGNHRARIASDGASIFYYPMQGTTADFSGNLQADYYETGSLPASSGGLRLGTQVEVRARNVANTANIRLIGSSSSDQVLIDGGGAGTSFGGSGSFSGNVIPNAHNTYDLGHTSYRWNYIYGNSAFLSGALSTSGDGAFGGNVTGANLSISNWNTAYGWGNHASAGYLTSSSLSSYLALSGGTLSGALGGTSASFSGNITAGGDITANSDIRLKKDVRSLGSISEQLRNLNAVSYRMKADNSAHIGFIAQELEKEFPLLVQTAAHGEKIKSVNYQALTAPLVKGWQEHDAIIKQQAEKIKSQEERISQLEKEMNELRNLIKQSIK